MSAALLLTENAKIYWFAYLSYSLSCASQMELGKEESKEGTSSNEITVARKWHCPVHTPVEKCVLSNEELSHFSFKTQFI